LQTFLNTSEQIRELKLSYVFAKKAYEKYSNIFVFDFKISLTELKDVVKKISSFCGSENFDYDYSILDFVEDLNAEEILGEFYDDFDKLIFWDAEQEKLKPEYPFLITDPKKQKLCCWFEVPQEVLLSAYRGGGMYARKGITGGRGFGLFTVARLDYVEKLQNYDWLVADINIFDAIPEIEQKRLERDRETLQLIFKELTRLTQEHYILGYPYPLVEAHNFVSIRRDFKDEVINRVKFSLYKDQQMDNVDIENLFLDIHDRF